LLAAFGANAALEADTREVRRELIVYLLFEELIGPHIGAIDSAKKAEGLRTLIDKHKDAIFHFKSVLNQRTLFLLAADSDEAGLRIMFRETIRSIEPELAEIANADRTAVKRLGQRVTESSSIWAIVASLVGAAFASTPAHVPAAFAIGALSVLGAASLGAKRDRDAKLRSSPWSLVYHATRTLAG
jgi:hypothetical protein